MKSLVLVVCLGMSFAGFSGKPDDIFATGFEASFTVGGNITGLDALNESVEIFLNGVSQTTVTSDGSYTSTDVVEAGQTFDVTIDNNNCTVMNGSGVMPNNAVTDANIDCPLAFTTVYDVKQGFATGDVALQNMLVVVCKDNFGYNLQTVPGDVDYIGDDYSGVFVFDGTIDCSVLQVGDRVDINPATVDVFFDEIQFNNATYAIQSSGNPLPDPVLTTTGALAGSAVHPLNGVLVEVQNVTVSALNSPDYELDMMLAVTNRHYDTVPFPEIGENMAFVIGPLQHSFSVNKIAPRSAADLGRASQLVINEMDYDQPASDDAEFIEIYNIGPGQADLSDLSIMLVDVTFSGTGFVDHAESLAPAGVLGAGEYLVYGDPDVVNALPPGTASITIPAQIAIENTGPYGIALANTVDEILLDALSYEGSITEADLGFANPVSLVEGNATSELDDADVGSMARIPNGQDTDDAVTDWLYTDYATPGSANYIVPPSTQLVINEVDYDQPGSDNAEFMELYNPGPNAVDLDSLAVVFVNGSNNSEYGRITLTGQLLAGGYAVIGAQSVLDTVPPGTLTFLLTNSIQNGGPDGLALIDTDNNTLLDALSYEGSITAAIINGFAAPVNLVAGNPTTASDTGSGSVIRSPNGQDSGDDSIDFANAPSPSPGETNDP